MKTPSQWEKAGVIAAIAGVVVGIFSVFIASGWPSQSDFCVFAIYESGHPASDTVPGFRATMDALTPDG